MMDTDTLVNDFQSRQATKKAESTAYDYARTVRMWAEWLANPGEKEYDKNNRNREAKELWEATTGDLRFFLRYQLDSGLAGGTISNRRWAIATFYQELERMADEDYGIPEFENPSEDLDLSKWQALKNGGKKKQELKGEVYLTPEEIKQLYENSPPPTLRNELIIRLLYQTGLRRGELAEIRLTDVNTDDREIKVHAEKTHLNRTVYYQASLDSLLERWKNVERKSLATAGSKYLFPTFKTEKISPKQINRIVRKAADAAGLQEYVYTNAEGRDQMKITAHVLRHSCAVQCIKNGFDTRRLQILLGHAKIETTERYLQFSNDDIRNAVRKFGAGSE